VLVEPTEHTNTPNSLVEHNKFENQQIHALGLEGPTVGQCKRVAMFWFRWVEAQGMEYT